MIYWGNDSRSNCLTRMSATVLVPQTIFNTKTLLSYKHLTPNTLQNNATVWSYLKYFMTYGSAPSYSVDGVGWYTAAKSGYVTIIADNTSFGVSTGLYDYLNPYDEPMTQYNAVLATKQLIGMHPELFGNSFVGLSTFNVVQAGYSLGAQHSAIVSRFINSDATNGLRIVNTIAGAPPNTLGNTTLILQDNSKPTSWGNTMFLIENIIGYPALQSILLPNIYNDVLPIFNAIRLPNPAYSAYDNLAFVSEFYNVLYASLANTLSGGVTNPHMCSTSAYGFADPSGFVYLDTIVDTSNYSKYLNSTKQGCFYTNPFFSFADLSGTPINIMYSAYDELCNYNPSNPNSVLDGSSNALDRVHNYFESWVTNSSYNDVLGNVKPPPINSLKRSAGNYSYNGNLVTNLVDANAAALVAQWVASDNTNNCSANRVNVNSTITHAVPKVYSYFLSSYLTARGAVA